MFPIRTILHGTDFSEHALAAFRTACALARDTGAKLIVAHVLTPGRPGKEEPGVPQEEARRQLREMLAREDIAPVERRLLEGDPAGELIELAAETGADVIVLGSHGHTALPYVLLGRVAEEVVRGASCPVLTLRSAFPHTQEIREREPETAICEQ